MMTGEKIASTHMYNTAGFYTGILAGGGGEVVNQEKKSLQVYTLVTPRVLKYQT